jgi:uncharacterized membrane protein required for colicin V production
VIASALTKGLKATIIRGPLAFIDQMAGAALHLVRTVIFIFLIGAILTWSPWQSGKDAIAGSDLYPKIESSLPGVVISIKDTVQEKLEGINLRP